MLKYWKKRWDVWPRGLRWLVGGVMAVVLALVLAWVLFVPAADWLAHHDVGSAKPALLLTARDDARGRLLTLGAGLFAFGALVYTARNYSLSREGQVTDRYTKAVEQLGSKEIDVRIGGIYALERIARDSAKDHPTVVEVLAAYVREHSSEQWPLFPADSQSGAAPPERTTRPDVQAALTAIGRRNPTQDSLRLNLAGANLSGANLIGANLDGADLHGAIFERADLSFAGLAKRTVSLPLASSHVTVSVDGRVDLGHANLTDANLNYANLTEAELVGTIAKRTRFEDATLTGWTFAADSAEANFEGAVLSSGDQVPVGWQRDRSSGRLKRIKTDPADSASN
jgi:Pentapeptide repeats (8 copies)